MTAREKRTVRLAAIGIAVYLAVFAGYQAVKFCASKRAEYDKLTAQAIALKAEVRRYDDKIAVVKKLMEKYQMDPAKLKKSTLVAESSSAIQKAAMGSGFGLGPIHETQGRSSGKELATIQFEGSGPVKAAVSLMSRLETLGYPLVIDSAQFSANPMMPGQLKLKLTVVILDFDQWLKEEPHA